MLAAFNNLKVTHFSLVTHFAPGDPLENVWDEIEKTQLKLLGNVKLTQKVKILHGFHLLLQPYLIFQPLSILYRFPDHLFHFFAISFISLHHGSQYLTSYYCCYQLLLHTRLTQISAAIF